MRYRQSYKEKQELEKAALVATGLVSEHYSGIAAIEFHMTYFQRGLHPVLMERTLSFSPANYASFHMKCMQEGCTNGGYDLAPVVAGLVKCCGKSVKGKIFCQGKNDTLCHSSISYEVNVRYNKQVK